MNVKRGCWNMSNKMPKPKKVMNNLDDLRSEIPKEGLLSPKLRAGFGEKFDVEKIHKQMFGK